MLFVLAGTACIGHLPSTHVVAQALQLQVIGDSPHSPFDLNTIEFRMGATDISGAAFWGLPALTALPFQVYI
jgi:hypothetical protein